MPFESQAEYEAYYSPEAKAARAAKIRADDDATITQALTFFDKGDEDTAAAVMWDGGFDDAAIAAWFAVWRS